MAACFLSNISAKYYKNPSLLSRVIANNVWDVFWDTVQFRNCLNVQTATKRLTTFLTLNV